LAAHGYIERGHAFVRHDDARFERQRSGIADALTLSARELVRVAACMIGRKVDALEQHRDTLALSICSGVTFLVALSYLFVVKDPIRDAD
jgi:hypothetical protein